MEVSIPPDCGNAPRMLVVADFAKNWASCDSEALSAMLADSVSWSRPGSDKPSHQGNITALLPPVRAERLVLHSVITHGRLASCDGYLQSDGVRIAFSHVLRFASTARSANIIEIRSYWIEMSAPAH